MSACGLNYVQASLQLNQRSFTNTPMVGQAQPASFTVSGIPSCAPVIKAFLYVGTVGTGGAVNATLANPASTSSMFPMSMVGADVSTCWGTTGTYNYRADVTALISGNGNYTISGVPTNTLLGAGTTDANGATLFIIYRDPTQVYTGNIVIADGSNVMANGAGGGGTTTVTGFNVCGTPTLTSHFMILSDLEQTNNTPIWFNVPLAGSANFTKTAATDQAWDFVSDPGSPALAGQSSASYGFNPGADCAGMMMAGMYYRSACLGCTATPVGPVTLTVSPGIDPLCPATVTAGATGGTGSYSYSWTGTAQTGSVVTALNPGVYTVTAKDDNNACALGSATVQVASKILTLTVTPDPNCPINASVAVTGGAGTFSYTWSGSAQTTSAVTGLSLGAHTVTAVNACAVGSATMLASRVTITLTATPDPGCGRTVSISATGGTGPHTFTWTGPTQTGSVITLLTPGPHTVTSANACSTGSTVVMVTPDPMTVTAVADATCGATATVSATGGSGTTTYTWTGTGNGLNTQAATALSAGVHTITTLNDCAMGSATILITPDPMTLTAVSNPTCGGTATVTASGGSGTNTFSWSPAGNNLNTAVASALTAGVHTITVKNNCAAGTETILITPNAMTVNATPNPTCGGTASVAVSGGSGTNTYTWTGLGNNLNSVTATALSAGVHTISAKNNCAAGSNTINITPNSMTLTATPNSTCGTTATVFVSGGSGTNNYSWSPTGSALTSSVATALSVGIHTVTARNNCAAGSLTVQITPTNMTLTVTPSPTCPTKATVVANGGSGTNTYSWTGTGTALTSTAATALSAGVHTITVRNTCAAGSETILITPISLTLSLANTSTVCPVNTTVTAVPGITAGVLNGPFSYTWASVSHTVTSTSSATLNTSTANLGTNLYTVTARDNDRCASGMDTIRVNIPATTVAITSPTNICVGDSITLRAGAGATASYTWSPPVFLNASNLGTVVVNSQPISSVIYTVNYRTSNGCANTMTTQITVAQTLTLSSTNSTLCEGVPLVINPAITGTNYAWQGPNSYTNANQAIIIPNASPTVSGVYSTTVSTAGTCDVFTAYNVTVFPAPTPSLSSNAPLCAGSTLSLSSTNTGGSTFYNWSGPNGFNSFQQNPVVTNASTLFSGPYYLNVTYTNSCTKLANLTVSISASPQPTISSNSPVCENGILTLSVTGGNSYQWTGPNSYASNLASDAIINAPVAASGVYSVIASIGTCTVAATRTLVVNPQPAINPVSNTPVCERGNLQLSSGAPNAIYFWSGPNSFTSNVQNPVIAAVQFSNSGSYTLTATGLNGTCPSTAVVSVSVSATPTVSAAGATVCLGAAATITASGASAYTWSGPAGFTANGASAIIPNLSGTGMYTVAGTGLSACAGTAVVQVVAKPLPPVSVLGVTLCEGQPATLVANGALSYTWNGPSGFTSNSANVTFQPAMLQNSGAYTVAGTGINSCSNSAVASLSVVSLPQLSISPSAAQICIGQSATLTASGAQTYTWLPINVGNNSPVHVVSPTLTMIFTVLGSNMDACNASTMVTIGVNDCTDVGFNELSGAEGGVLVYPNPSSSDIFISSEKDLDLTLINELGQLIRSIRLDSGNERTYSVSGLAYGVYYLVSPGFAFSRKIVVGPN